MQQIREARNGAGQESPARRRGTNGVAQHRPRATVVHQMAGRTRLRIPDKRRDQPYFDQVADRLRELPGVTQVEANATTASVLIEHEQNLDDLAEAISGNSGLASLVGLVLETPPVAQRLRSEIMTLDDEVQRLSGGKFDLGTVASFGLLGLAAVQLVMGQQLASAVALCWYAAELVRRSSSGEPIGTPPG